MADSYKDRVLGVSAPIRSAVAVTPSDSADLAKVCRAIHVGVAGDLVVILADDTTAVTIKANKGLLPVMVSRVKATGTTATDILALY